MVGSSLFRAGLLWQLPECVALWRLPKRSPDGSHGFLYFLHLHIMLTVKKKSEECSALSFSVVVTKHPGYVKCKTEKQ